MQNFELRLILFLCQRKAIVTGRTVSIVLWGNNIGWFQTRWKPEDGELVYRRRIVESLKLSSKTAWS